MKIQMQENDDAEAESKRKVAEAQMEASKRDDTIFALKQEIKDEINKQKLVEKKGHASVSSAVPSDGKSVYYLPL